MGEKYFSSNFASFGEATSVLNTLELINRMKELQNKFRMQK
jgi:hypothetical protein